MLKVPLNPSRSLSFWHSKQESAQEVVRVLNFLGVDAYRGTTQLNVVESDGADCDGKLPGGRDLENIVARYPQEARYLIDHIVYLPVNKLMPFEELDRICDALTIAMASTGSISDSQHRASQTNVRLKSKL